MSDELNGENTPDASTTQRFGPDFKDQLQGLEGGLSQEEQDIVHALPEGSGLLIVRRGPAVGARFLLDQDRTVAGRHPDADIFLDDVTVSRRHAEFVRHGSSFEVRDLGSLNGTYFDGVLIDQALLHEGAEVQVGKFRMTFYPSPADNANRGA
jgi:pSer/pThr/pTyr-binding forkhead associated (FHA) protein